EAPSVEEAQQMIEQMGYIVTKITEVQEGEGGGRRRKTSRVKSFWSSLRSFLGRRAVRAPFASPQASADAQAGADAGKEESIIHLTNSLEAAPDLPRPDGGSIDLESLTEIRDAPPVRKLLNMVMLLAIRDHASDIHFEPFEDKFQLRFRCDGVLMELVPPPR